MTELNNTPINAQLPEMSNKNNSDIAKLRSENILLKKIIALLPGNVYWKSKEGVILGCNQNVAHVFKLNSIDEVVGKRNRDLPLAPDLAAILDEIDNKIYSTGIGTTVEEYAVNRDNPAVYISKKIPLFDDTGQVIGLLGVSFDITERKQMEEDLKIAKEKAEEANRSKTEFITNLSHDVKTPLAGIIGVSELLTYRLSAEELDFAQVLLTSSRQLLNFFDNCLEVFKLENSKATLVIENFNLKTIISEICDIFSPTIISRNLFLAVDYPDTVAEYISGSRTGIYRIILNLVSNAVKFTTEGGVTIRIREHDEKLQIIVEDTGIGIPLDKQEAIFQNFTRLTPSYRGTYDGSGIGLYIVHKFITSMQGTIDVTSAPEEGSQFIVTLPLHLTETQPINIQADIIHSNQRPVTERPLQLIANKNHSTEQDAVKILLVEDNHVVQRIQSSLLSSFGCKVDIAETGEQALDAFAPGKYDLIFMDIGLPDMQGDLTAKLIRKLERGNEEHVPIIALTAHVSENAATTHTVYGINETLQKPLSREQAKKVIEKFVVRARGTHKKSQHLESVKRMLII